jgi:hypothetical protein
MWPNSTLAPPNVRVTRWPIMLPRPVYVRCSFCGKTKEQVGKLIAGPEGVAICDECVDLCSEILKEEPITRPAPRKPDVRDRVVRSMVMALLRIIQR